MLMAAVLYHAFNGIRVTVLDYRPEWWRYERQTAVAVWILFAITYVPIGLLMFSQTLGHCSELASQGSSCWTLPTP